MLKTKLKILLLLSLFDLFSGCSNDFSKDFLKNPKSKDMAYNKIGVGTFKTPTRGYIVDRIDKTAFTGGYFHKFGFLYNWWAAIGDKTGNNSTDSEITSLGFHIPTSAEWNTIITAAGGNSTAGGTLKESDLMFWNSPISGGSNDFGFNGRGSGRRDQATGNFLYIKEYLNIWGSNTSSGYAYQAYIQRVNTNAIVSAGYKNYGYSLRAVADNTTLNDGETGTYVGNDGKTYPTICIGGIEITAVNLSETKFRDGTWIHGFDGGVYTPISNAEWIALTSQGMCAYQDNVDNAFTINNSPETIEVTGVTVDATDRDTGETTNIDITDHVTDVIFTDPSTGTETNTGLDTPIALPDCVYTIEPILDIPINQILDPSKYKDVQIKLVYVFRDINGDPIPNLIPEILQPILINLFFDNTPTEIAQSAGLKIGNILIFDTMTLEDFKHVAAQRMELEPQKIRVDQRVVHLKHTSGDAVQTIILNKLNDSKKSVCYIKDLSGVGAVAGTPTIKAVSLYIDHDDNAAEQEYEIYNSSDAVFQTGNFFAEKIELDGTMTGQAIVYYAERLV